jgi:hypothetical protein
MYSNNLIFAFFILRIARNQGTAVVVAVTAMAAAAAAAAIVTGECLCE